MPTQVGDLVVFGDIEIKWLSFGGLAGALGRPTTNESPTFDTVGREQKFQGGFVSWHPDDGVKAHVVWGLIGERWNAIGREQFGYAVSDELDFPGGGKHSTFRALHLAGRPEASIVWQPGAHAAWEVYGAMRESWVNSGSIVGPMRFPVDQERPAFDNRGRFQHFEGGAMSWHPDVAGGPFMIWGLVLKRWLEVGRENFGYPTSHELTFPDGAKYQNFRAIHMAGNPEATIVWKPGASAAWEVYGAIRQCWIDNGYGMGQLGYPVHEEKATTDGAGRFQSFEHGSISWYPGTDARVAIYQPWAVVLCRFKGAAPDPVREEPVAKFYREAFTPGSGGLVEYWREATLGAVDITGTRVIGWVEIEIPRDKAGGTASSSPVGPGRLGLINYGINAVPLDPPSNPLTGLPTSPLTGRLGPIVVYNENWSKDGAPDGATWATPGWFQFWIDGSADGLGRVALTPQHDGNITAHEMGHVLRMNHDVGPDLNTDYSDPCCIMSQNNPYTHPTWGRAFGPAICLPHLMQRGWMHKGRVYYDDGGWQSQANGITQPLAPISRPSARANLGIKLAFNRAGAAWDYYLEYVHPSAWNQGILKPRLVIRRMAPKYGGTPAYLGLIDIPSAPGTRAAFVEPSGNVRFEVELTTLEGPIISVNARKL
jgi:hypothetical protein